MKTKFSRIGKKSLSLIITIMLIFSTMLVGMVSTEAVTNGKFKAGEIIYFDFSKASFNGSNKEANILESWYIDSTGTTNLNSGNYFTNINGIVQVKLSQDLDFSTYTGFLFKTNKDNWAHQVNGNTSKTPTGGQNMIVVSSNDSDYTWSTYGGGTTTKSWGLVGNINGRGDSGWSDYASSIHLTKQSTNVYYASNISITSSNQYFRVIDSDGNQFGPYNDYDNNADITKNTSSGTTYKTSANSAKALYFNASSSFTCTIYVNVANPSNPEVWYVKNVTKYAISTSFDSSMGSVTKSVSSEESGKTVTFTVTPGAKYFVSSVKILKTTDSSLYRTLSVLNSGKAATYSFSMPSYAVTISVGFEEIVTPDPLTVTLKSNSSEVTVGGKITLTATASPTGTGYTYEFFKSTDGSSFTSLGAASSANTKQVTLSDEGTYRFKVKVTSSTETAESSVVTVKASAMQGQHMVKVWFKSSSGSVYVPSVSLDNGAYKTMTRDKKTADDNGTYFGSTYTGALKFYWYYTEIAVDSTKSHTLTFRTSGTSVNAKSNSSNLNLDNYYFAVDNLMNDTKLVDLTDEAEYIKNYHHSATHMIYSSLEDDNTLGFTYVENKEYAMGTYIEDRSLASNIASTTPFSVKSATLAQKVSAEIDETSELQQNLLDVNLDGRVDVRDATMMQKAIVGI